MTLGQRIQKLRKGAGLTQEQLAERMGVTRQAVSKWESDGGVPELDTLIAMSRLFHVTIGQLLGVEELRKSGVGSGEDGGQTQVGTGLHEAQVEAILRRYVEATQKQAQPSLYGKYGWKAPLLAVAGLAAVVLVLGLFISSMNSTIGNMRATLSNLQTTVWDWEYEMANMQSQIRQMQEEQNSLFSSLDSAVTGFDPERETVELELSAVLKTYTPRTQLQFVLAWGPGGRDGGGDGQRVDQRPGISDPVGAAHGCGGGRRPPAAERRRHYPAAGFGAGPSRTEVRGLSTVRPLPVRAVLHRRGDERERNGRKPGGRRPFPLPRAVLAHVGPAHRHPQ